MGGKLSSKLIYINFTTAKYTKYSKANIMKGECVLKYLLKDKKQEVTFDN